MIKTIIIGSFTLFVFLLGYSIQAEVPIVKYFWPLTVGKTFVYEMDKGEVVRSLLIKEVSKKDSYINVKIEESIKGYDFPISFVEEYLIDLKQNVIFRNKGLMDEKIYLKGPVKVGTKWNTKITEIKSVLSKEKKTTERIIKEGRCIINNLYDEFVLDRRRPCIEVNCSILKTDTQLTKFYFCEGLGYVGMKSITSGEWIERLKKIE